MNNMNKIMNNMKTKNIRRVIDQKRDLKDHKSKIDQMIKFRIDNKKYLWKTILKLIKILKKNKNIFNKNLMNTKNIMTNMKLNKVNNIKN